MILLFGVVMNKFFIIFLLFSSSCFSQTLIWEREYQDDAILIPVPLMLSLLPTIIDKDGNIVTAIDPHSPIYMNSAFIKYDIDGNLLSYKSYNLPKASMPLSIIRSDNGYRMFCGISASPIISGYLPMIFMSNMDGDSLSTDIPYDVDNDKLYDSLPIIPNEGNNRIGTLASEGKYYNATIKQTIRTLVNDETTKPHLILTSYDANGKIIWRKGMDTLDAEVYYGISDIKLLKSNNFLLLTRKYINKEYKMQIIEFDANGNIIKKIDPLLLDKSFLPLSIEQLPNNDYVVLGNRYVKDTTTNKLIRLNSEGEYIESLVLPKRNLGVGCNFMRQAPNGNLVLIGSTALLECDTNTCTNKQRIMMFCFDKDFNYISELEYCEHKDDDPTDIRNIYFLDNENFIAIGYKSRYKFYIAKFSLKPNNVDDEEISRNNLEISPNPANDFITITMQPSEGFEPSDGSAIQIFNTLGEIVLSDSARHAVPLRMNIESLPKGMYFVRIGGETAKFVKM